MGCDIHLFVEKRIDGKWECIDEIEEGEEGYLDIPFGKKIYYERNSALWYILAGVHVRNMPRPEPHFEPLGLPADISEIIQKTSDQWGEDGYAHSYFSLRELLDYREKEDFAKEISSEFFIDVLNKLKELGSPEDIRIVFWFND